MTKQEKLFTGGVNVLIMAVVCTLLWGSAFPCVKIGYELFGITGEDIYSKILFAGIRFGLAGIIVILFQTIKTKRFITPTRDNIKDVIALGFVQTTLQYLFFYIGMANTTGVKGSVIDATSTFFAIIIAHFMLKNDRLNMKKIIGCLFGIAGAVIINLTDELNMSFDIMGEGMVLISAVAFAMSSVMIKRISNKCDPIMLTGYQMFFGAGILVITGLVGGGAFGSVSVKAVLLLVYMAMISSVAFVVWNLLLKYNPVGKITLYSFLIPVFGAILSAVFLGEAIFTLKNLAALILVSVGIFIVNRN